MQIFHLQNRSDSAAAVLSLANRIRAHPGALGGVKARLSGVRLFVATLAY